MSRKWTLEQETGIYVKYVGWVNQGRENWETFAWEALIIRSALFARWGELTEAQQRQIYQADEFPAKNHRRLQEVLPGAGVHDHSEWWWFLHEGPQVRTEMFQVA